jgi:cell division protein FtsN
MSSSTRASSAQPEPAVKPDPSAAAPGAAAIPSPPTPPAAASLPASAPLPASAGEQFDLVVASFRTEARAASVAAEVTALGLPIRRRVSDGWQQVIAGPFASRTAAEDAQRRLEAAGLTGTQITQPAR